MQQDEVFMYQALQLASLGQFTARPNPMVGALLVKNGQVIGEGFHAQAGLPHAERVLLSKCALKTTDATLYVTLEPCTHTGRTLPCIDEVLKHPLKRVVIATADPNPIVRGNGIAALKSKGIEVVTNVLHDRAIALNIGFFTRQQTQKPYVRAKVAMSLDGKVAMQTGESQWITSDKARQSAHLWRARSGAIITTHETVKQDDCQLTIRNPKLADQIPPDADFVAPLKVILAKDLNLSPKSKIFEQGKCLVTISTAISESQQAAFLEQLPNADNVKLVCFPLEGEHLAFGAILQYLAEIEINEVMVEAGPKLLTGLLKEQHIDELLLYMAPDLMGQQTQSMQNLSFSTLAEKLQGEFYQINKVGRDLECRVLLSPWSKEKLQIADFKQELLCSSIL